MYLYIVLIMERIGKIINLFRLKMKLARWDISTKKTKKNAFDGLRLNYYLVDNKNEYTKLQAKIITFYILFLNQ